MRIKKSISEKRPTDSSEIIMIKIVQAESIFIYTQYTFKNKKFTLSDAYMTGI